MRTRYDPLLPSCLATDGNGSPLLAEKLSGVCLRLGAGVRRRSVTLARSLAPLVGVLLFAVTAEASVLCAKRQRDGSLNGPVKIRPACRAGEVTPTPDMVGFCCTVTTTTTSTTASTTMPCPTTTTL